MKKGSKIQVLENAKYNGQDMLWTEPFTGTKKIGKDGEWVTHTSSNKIKEFRAKEICVHPYEHSISSFESNTTKKEVTSKYNWEIFVYAIFLPEGTIVDTYSDDEYRFELTEEFNIFFAGTIYEAKGKTIINKYNKLVDTYIKYSDTLNFNKLC